MSEILEKDVENYMYQSGDCIKVNDVEIVVYAQQVKVGEYYIDLLARDDEDNIYVIELKKGTIDGNALSQVLFYMDYVSLYNSKTKYRKKIYGVLIGNGVTTYMENALKQVDNVFYVKYKQKFSFEELVWSWADEYLKSEKFKKECDLFNELTIGFEKDYDDYIRELKEVKEMEELNNGKKKNGKPTNS